MAAFRALHQLYSSCIMLIPPHTHTHTHIAYTNLVHFVLFLFFFFLASHDIWADMSRNRGQRVRYVVMKITVALYSAFGIIAARICVYAQRLLFVTGPLTSNNNTDNIHDNNSSNSNNNKLKPRRGRICINK